MTAFEKSVLRWTEVWFQYPADAQKFAQKIERINSTIIADANNRIAMTNASGRDIRKVLASTKWEGRHILGSNVDRFDKAAENPRPIKYRYKGWHVAIFHSGGQWHGWAAKGGQSIVRTADSEHQAASTIEQAIVAQNRFEPSAANPLNVNRHYSRHRQLQRDLTRYYENCIHSHSSHRFQCSSQKDYCARVAWTIALRKYPDYKHATEGTMFESVGNLVSNTVSEVQDFMENPMSTPEKAAIAIGGGVALALGVAYFFMKNANAAPSTPPNVLSPNNLLQNPGASPGSRVFAATTAASGQTVNMAVGDTLAIVLPNTANSGYDWLSPFAGAASGVNSPYPGLNRTNPTSGAYIMGTDSAGNITETDNYTAASTNNGTVQMVYLLLPVGSKGTNLDANGKPQSFVDANGNPVTPQATFYLNYTIS